MSRLVLNILEVKEKPGRIERSFSFASILA